MSLCKLLTSLFLHAFVCTSTQNVCLPCRLRLQIEALKKPQSKSSSGSSSGSAQGAPQRCGTSHTPAPGASIMSPFRPPQRVEVDDGNSTQISVSTQQVRHEDEDGIQSFESLVDFAKSYPAYIVRVLDLKALSYPQLKAAWPEMSEGIHDYSLQRSKYNIAFSSMCAAYGLDYIDSEIEVENWVYSTYGGLCLENPPKRKKQLRLVSRVMLNAILTYYGAPTKFWHKFRSEQEVDDGYAPGLEDDEDDETELP